MIGALSFILLTQTPGQRDLTIAMKRVEELRTWVPQHVYNVDLRVRWMADGKALWYRKDGSQDRREFVRVDTLTGAKSPLFDHVKLAASLGKLVNKAIEPAKLQIDVSTFEDGKSFQFTFERKSYSCDLLTYEVTTGTVLQPEQVHEVELDNDARLFPSPRMSALPQRNRPQANRRVFIEEGKVKVTTDSGAVVLSSEGDFSRAVESPDAKAAFAWKLSKGDRREVSIIQSSPPGGGRALLKTRFYDLPGDKLDTFELYQVNLQDGSLKKLPIDPINGGGQPWANAPGIEWVNEGKYAMVDSAERGYQRVRVYEIEPATSTVRTVVDESSPTFIDSENAIFRAVGDRDIVWRSERSGWGHYYRIDRATGSIKNPITSGSWVTRGIDWIDEKSGTMCFHANGKELEQDPYNIHYYTVNLDGSKLQSLTEGDGSHTVVFNSDRSAYVDTFSRVNHAPIHQLRRTNDGRLISELETADISELKATKIKLMEPFVAKGRDGTTDIYGVYCLPSNFDKKKKYPIIENIYAGPQDSFVPKKFSAYNRMQQLADVGFIVVQIDGMGTRNRGKQFHDVCWKNIVDAGFPDRILWMKALASKLPSVDITRVGVYGTSAGGQNSTGAVLTHPEFYKVAVSSCGCHDNRMDKMWWNEQWMGYPVGPHYAEQSNITLAPKLEGRLLLIVGELDTNVPPESTYRLVDALVKAKKDFDFVVIPGADHTDGGPYGETKRRDFFIKHLLGVDPPQWSQR
ncbi:MAG: prolyl oligopeptidase family serine peptidase [Fimbriimonadaceae bacterium]